MWNEPAKEQLAKIPKLYETERVPLKEKLIWLHFFIGGCDWYVAEYDEEENLFWGYAILNGDLEMAEWGYCRLMNSKASKSLLALKSTVKRVGKSKKPSRSKR